MKSTGGKLYNRMIFLCFLFVFVFTNSLPLFAGPSLTTYQAKIIKPDGNPLEASNVTFKFSILNPAASCIVYSELYSSVNMTGSQGLISFSLGSGVRTYPTSGTVTFEKVFANSTPSLACDTGGPPTYSPGANDVRKIVMQFFDGTAWQTLPAMSINAVPYAMYASDSQKLNGKADTDFVEVANIPTCLTNQALFFNGMTFSCVTTQSVSATAVITALGYTPANAASLTTVTSTVGLVSSTVAAVSSSLTSLQNTVAASFAAISASSGLTSLNGSTSSTQTFANGVAGTAPAFLSINGVHTLNIPLASAASVTAGLISNFDYLNFAGKITSSAASIAEVLGYTPAASGSAGVGALLAANNLSDVASSTVARNNLGLGQLALLNSLDLSSSFASGTLSVARLPAFIGDATIAAASNTIVLSNTGVTAGTYTKLTVDNKGRVTSSSALAAIDVTTALGFTPVSAAAASQWVTSGTTINYMTGNVGIGTTNPTASLDVSGTGRFAVVNLSNNTVNSESGPLNVKRQAGSANSVIAFFDSTNTSVARLTTFTTGGFGFLDGTGIAEWMRIGSNGNVGIGTAAPSAKLHLSSGTSTVASFKLTSGTLLTSPASGSIEYDGFDFYFTDGTNTRRSLASYAGVASAVTSINGSTSQTQTFAIGATGTTPAFLTSNGVHTLNIPLASAGLVTAGLISNADYLNFAGKITSSSASIAQVLGYVPASVASSTQWLTSGTTISYSTGNVGIGTSTPGSALDVLGQISGRSSIVALGTDLAYRASFNSLSNNGYMVLRDASQVQQVYLSSNGSSWLNGGNIGIGTTTPSARLQLASGTSTLASFKLTSGTLLTSPASGSIEYDGFDFYFTDGTNTRRSLASYAGSGAGSSNTSLISNASGSITLSPLNSVIVSSTTASTSFNTGALIVAGGVGVAGNIFSSGAISTSSNIQGASITALSGVSTTVITGAPYLALNPGSGNVGIGTTAPSSKLHVEGSVAVTNGTINQSSWGSTTYLTSGASSTYPVASRQIEIVNISGIDDTAALMSMRALNTNGNSQNAYLGVKSNTGAGVYTPSFVIGQQTGVNSYSERLRIDGSGNVGIGTTNPISQLHVNGQIRSDSGFTLSGFGQILGSNNGLALRASTGNPIRLQDPAGAGDLMTLLSTGNVGIGTASPTAPLEVRANGSTNPIRISRTNASHDAGITYYPVTPSAANPTWGAGLVGSTAGFSIRSNDGTTTTSRFYINETGNVGIGTTAPAYKLDVSGTINATAISINGVDIGSTGGSSSTSNQTFNSNSDASGADGGFNFQANGANLLTVANDGATTVISPSASAFTVGANGSTNPVLSVDASTPSVTTGLAIKGAASGGTTSLTATDSGANANLSIDAKGSGAITIGGTSTGGTTIGGTSGGNTTMRMANGNSFAVNINSTNRFSVNTTSVVMNPSGAGNVSALTFSTSNVTNMTAGANIPIAGFSTTITGAAAPITRQHATGALPLIEDYKFVGATDSFVGASTLTDAATLGLTYKSCGANATCTNVSGLYIPTAVITGAVSNSYGINVSASTGATNNYAATFMGGNVGIGTTSPGYKLDVNGDINATGLRVGGIDILGGIQYINQTVQVDYSTVYSPTSVVVSTPVGARGTFSNTNTTSGTGAFVNFTTGNNNRTSYIGAINGGAGVTQAIVFGQQTGVTSYTERMRIDSSGNVGIGTTGPAYSLDVAGDARVTGWIRGAGGAAMLRSTGGGQTEIYGASGLPITMTTSGSERLRIDSSGNVGIGMTSPNAKLHLASGTSTVASFKMTSGTLLTSPASGSIEYDGFDFYFTDGTNTRRSLASYSGGGSSNTSLISNASGDITLSPLSSVIVSSTTASTNSQTGALIVSGGVGVAGNIFSSGTIITSSNIQGASITATNGVSTTVITGSPSLALNPYGGYVGIGTTSPSYDLHVRRNQNAQTTIGVHNTSSGTGSSVWYALNSDVSYGGLDLSSSNSIRPNQLRLWNIAGPISFQASGSTPSMFITTAGNVGIGTASPTARLTVSGTGATSATASMHIINGASSTLMYIRNDGNVGIGTMAPAQPLDVNGSINVPQNTYYRAGGIGVLRATTTATELRANTGLGITLITNSATNALSLASNGAASFTSSVYAPSISVGAINPTRPVHVYEFSPTSGSIAIDNNGSTFTSGVDFLTSGNLRGFVGLRGTGSDAPTPTNSLTMFLWNYQTAPMIFGTANGERMRIDSAGNVGIGTSSATTSFEVASLDTAGAAGGIRFSESSGSSSGYVAIKDNTTSANQFEPKIEAKSAGALRSFTIENNLISAQDTGSAPVIIFNTVAAGASVTTRPLFDFQNNGSSRMLMTASGSVGIGTTNPSYTLDVSGTLRVTGTAYTNGGYTTWTAASDRRLKDIHGNYERGLVDLLNINTIKFQYKANNKMGLDSSKEFVGVTAQNLKTAIPEAVTEETNGPLKGYLTINTTPVLWTVINAVKQLYKQVIERFDIQDRQIASIVESKADKTEIEVLKLKAAKVDKLEAENQAKAKEIDALKAYLCKKDPAASICK